MVKKFTLGTLQTTREVKKDVFIGSARSRLEFGKGYWNGITMMQARDYSILIPVAPEGYEHPGEGYRLRILKVVVSTDTNTLFGVDLLHVFDRNDYGAGAYAFATEYSYQKVKIEPEAYAISYPGFFAIGIDNPDSEDHIYYIYWIGSWEKI